MLYINIYIGSYIEYSKNIQIIQIVWFWPMAMFMLMFDDDVYKWKCEYVKLQMQVDFHVSYKYIYINLY